MKDKDENEVAIDAFLLNHDIDEQQVFTEQQILDEFDKPDEYSGDIYGRFGKED